MGQDEATQVSRVRTHVLGLNVSLNTSDIRVYIPTYKFEFSLYEQTVRHGYAMTLKLILSL